MYAEDALAHERHQRRQDDLAAAHLAAAARRTTDLRGTNAAVGNHLAVTTRAASVRRVALHLIARTGDGLRWLLGTHSRRHPVAPTTLRRA